MEDVIGVGCFVAVVVAVAHSISVPPMLISSRYTVSTNPIYKSGMCPVNVHWHLGAEHYSYGQYDESGVSPQNTDNQKNRDMSSGVIFGEVASSVSGKSKLFRCFILVVIPSTTTVVLGTAANTRVLFILILIIVIMISANRSIISLGVVLIQ